MKGSAVAAAPSLQALQNAKKQLRINLSNYDQEYFYSGRCINSILNRPNTFLHELKCEEEEQWMQKCFKLAEANKETGQLVEYYRFYKNSPTLADQKYLVFMGGYWSKKKSLYYRRIKRQLQIQDEVSEGSADQHVQQTGGKCSESLWTGTFQLPSQLSPQNMMGQTDPDATIRRLLLTMSAKKQHKSTRQVSKIADFQEKSAKSKLKNHLKTNPSQLISTSEFKKSKRKPQHKSMSNEPRVCQNKKSNEKHLNVIASCQKIGLNQPQLNLNYQRRNKPKQSDKQSNKKRLSNNKQMGVNKKKESTKKGKSGQKSISVVRKSKSGRKSKEVQTSANVKAVIDKVKDKIKAQKSVMLKKYIESRQSCKSNDSTWRQTAKRLHK